MSRRLRCVIQTAPSTVARQIAPCALGDDLARRGRAAPARGGRRRGGTRCPRSCRARPGGPRRRGSCGPRCRCESEFQSIARTSWRHQRARAGRSRAGRRSRAARARAAVGDPAHRLHERLDRGAADLVAVQAALAGLARAGTCASPRRRRRRRSPLASSTVTPHSRIPSSIAQSSDDGPRSPLGPGCTIRQRCCAQIDSGMIVLSIGQTISCGRCSPTAASIAAAESTTATVTSWPSSVSAIQRALAEAVVRRDEEQDRSERRSELMRHPSSDDQAELLEHQQAVEHQVSARRACRRGPWPPARSPGRPIGRCARRRRGARGTCPPRPRRRRSCAVRAPPGERRESPPASGGGSPTHAALPFSSTPPGARQTTSSASTSASPSRSWALNVSVALSTASRSAASAGRGTAACEGGELSELVIGWAARMGTP